MLEDYINRIESIISPNHYSKENYKEKLQIDGSKIPKDYGAVQENEEEEREEEEDKNIEIEQNQEQKESPLDQEQKEIPVEQKEEKTPKKAPAKAVNKPKASGKKTKPITSSATKLKQKASKENEEEGEEQSVASENPELSKTKTSLKEYSQSDIKQLLDKVHNLNKKNMNYRYDIEKLKTRIQILENEKKEQAEAMEKVEKQKSQLSQYLVRLEKTLNKQDNTMREFKPPVEKVESASTTFKKTLAKPRVTYGVNPPASTIKSIKKKTESNLDNSQLSEAKSTLSIFNSPTVAIDIGGNNIITITDTTTNKSVTLSNKADQKNFLLKVAKENQKLKSFQSQVFELSKTYDDINENLVSSMKNLENLFANKNKESSENQQPEEEEEGEENVQPVEKVNQQELLDKFQDLLVSAENLYNPNPEEEKKEGEEEKKKEEEEKKEGEEEEKKELTPEEKLEADKQEITEQFQGYIKTIETELKEKQQDFQKQLLEQYQNLVENVEKTLETKQEEYNKLLKTKDDQIDMMTNEITGLRSDIEARKKDRIKDLHIISTLEEDNKNLKDSLLKGDLGEPKGKNKDLLYNLNEASMGTLKPKGGDSRVEPMKKMLGSIVEKIEANFDLNDRENIQMIETLHKTLK